MASPPRPLTVTLAFTGASGMPYGIRLLETLLAAGTEVWLLYSQVSQIVARQEMDLTLPSRPSEAAAFFRERFNAKEDQLKVFGREEWFAPAASGSNPADAMVICPCTMGTLASVASGLAANLTELAADVMLKERRPLILVPMETPLSSIHLENMLRLSQAGATILPANPGFYTRPRSVQDIVDFVVARVLDQLRIPNKLMPRWGEQGDHH
ncbi:MAG: UbiX family flavin prenyltransferase [Betaproteobacteria bacterium]|nr:UbiX family flavin prenyltransferase [Betaproteobacteria bacterium]